MKILLAEDSRVYQHLISSHLRQWGFEVELAQSGTEAWEILRRPDTPTLALLDWVLPGMDGIELCRSIRKREADDRYIYTVLLTGKNEKKDLVRALEAGADDYLAKPFDAEELRTRLLAGKRILDLHKELVSVQESLRIAATHDSLTTLWNRPQIVAVLERELVRARRESKPVGIALVDVDHFKSINDTLGHHCGDLVLKEIACRLRSKLRPYDGIGRYGGEEFLAVLPGCDMQVTIARADEIRRCVVQGPIVTESGKESVTVSIGVTVAQGTPSDLTALLRKADLALYRAKNNGRNRVEQFQANALHVLSV
jgi:diguanylate cyclase (GGDEF)-like protein